MKIKLSKSQWEIMGKKSGWMKEAQLATPTGAPQPATANQIGTQEVKPQQPQQPKQMQIFNQNYQNLMRALNALRPDIQNKASAAFSNAFNSVQKELADPNSWMQ